MNFIKGNQNPVIGVTTYFEVVDLGLGSNFKSPNNLQYVWNIYKKGKNGKFTTTNNKKLGRSDFTFGQSAAGETYRLEAYLYSAEGGGLIVTPKPTKIPKINKVELFYVDNSKGVIFSYKERLRAKANCVKILGKELVFTLWEDDAKYGGHSEKNKNSKIVKILKIPYFFVLFYSFKKKTEVRKPQS